MSNKKSSLEANQLFSVYAGGGVFLSAMASDSVVLGPNHFDCELRQSFALTPILFERRDAIRACHMARAQGVNSWLVAAA